METNMGYNSNGQNNNSIATELANLIERKKQSLKPWRRAVVYLAWGEKYIQEVSQNAQSAVCLQLPLILITNESSKKYIPEDHPFTKIVYIKKFRSHDMLNKSTLWDHLPLEYDSFLYLDTDTHVIDDLSLGFEQAEKHGMALSQATSYCLSSHHNFRRIMVHLGIPDAGQLQYNAGVYFFIRRNDVKEVFSLYQSMAYELSEQFDYKNRAGNRSDQPFLTLAMEILGFNPYTLSINYCYRGIDAEPLSGNVRIWHSHYPVPPELNNYKNNFAPRRRYRGGKLVNMEMIYKINE